MLRSQGKGDVGRELPLETEEGRERRKETGGRLEFRLGAWWRI